MSDPDASTGRSEHAERRGESEEERLDRNLMELLQELRVAIPGIQFLFAFLLVVPFQQGWAQVTDFEKTVYYVTLLLTAASSICLIAPTARHRMRFRELDKRWIVETSNRLAIAGLAFLAAAICGVADADHTLRLRQRPDGDRRHGLRPLLRLVLVRSRRLCASFATRTEPGLEPVAVPRRGRWPGRSAAAARAASSSGGSPASFSARRCCQIDEDHRQRR